MENPINVLIVSKGHEYQHDSFLSMFAGMDGIRTTLVEQPAAQDVLAGPGADDYDVVFFYDMSGIPGVGLVHDRADEAGNPPESYVKSIERLLNRGAGLLLVNHATVSWPQWPLWREIHGSSFMLSAGRLDDQEVPGSGYRGGHGPLPSATIKLVPQRQHPVLAGLEDGFLITDELYLKTAAYEQQVLPLLRGDYEFVQSNFTPPPLAPAEEQAQWQHPPGSDLIVWANRCGKSPIVVSDVGDSPLAYDDTDYRRLIENSLRWLASAAARKWAQETG